MNVDTIDLSALRKAGEYDTADYYDDSGDEVYLYARGEDNTVWIWSKSYYQQEGCISDQASDHMLTLKLDPNDDWNFTFVYDATFDELRRELKKLGFDEVSESSWADSMFEPGDPQKLIDFMEAHPRFEHCPTEEV